MKTAVEEFRKFVKHTRRVPYPGTLDQVNKAFSRLVANGFSLPEEPWLQPAELAAFTKYLIMLGSSSAQYYDLAKPLNHYKDFWSAAEAENPYPKDPQFIAAFVVRFVYQQIPFQMYPERIKRAFARMHEMFFPSSKVTDPAREFEKASGIPLSVFLRIAEKAIPLFRQASSASYESLAACLADAERPFLRPFLDVASADRAKFKTWHEKTHAKDLFEKPYKINPLLRFPIVFAEGEYWCPFPEVIAYSATRGLFYYLSDACGPNFNVSFGSLYEDLACRRAIQYFGKARVITEEEERGLGWEGKTNDFTVLIDEKAVLFECKTSALFLPAKRHASLDDIRSDIRKNLVNSKDRSGLFQLYDKIEAIKAKILPAGLNEFYSGVKEFYAVLLLYDQIQYANKPESLRSLLEEELVSNGLVGFDFQIWHFEELENLIDLIPTEDFPSILVEKFSRPKCFQWDLNIYMFNKTGRRHRYLQSHLWLPVGNTPAERVLQLLADAD